MRTCLPTITSLQTFEAVARHGSFVSAADERGVTASAVSHQIADLEYLLELRLFDRTVRGVLLTRAGEFYLRTVRGVLLSLSAATTAVRQDGSTPIAIRTYGSVINHLLLPLLAGFLATFPGVNVVLRHPERDRRFVTTQPELMIMYGRPDAVDGEIIPIASGALAPVCTYTYLQNAAPLRVPSDVKDHRISRNNQWLDDWEAWLSLTGATPQLLGHGLVMPSRNACVAAMRAGLGVALVPRFLVTAFAKQDGMVIPFEHELPTIDIHLVVPTILKGQPEVDAFCDWLLTKTADLRPPGMNATTA
jgi:LysR family glycine cleavage system transcriptional activator